MAKLMDVARAAGVSRGTASNVFAHPERVGAELRARVENAARDLGYDGPDPTARFLRAGRVNAIGVVPSAEFATADALRNPFFRMFLSGVAEVCDDVGANLVLLSGSGKTVRDAVVDGFILTRAEYVEAIDPVRRRHLPFVVMDVEAPPETRVVRVDAHGGCRAAAEHLATLGHRRFGIISFLRQRGPAVVHPPTKGRGFAVAGLPIDRDKMRGYADALAAVGVDIDDVPLVQAHPADASAAGMILDAAPDATAILSMTDMQAIAVMAEARRRGLEVPQQLSVVGFNDIPEAAMADPPLTTVDGRGIERGRAAARMLFAGGAPRQEVIPSSLVVRGSTGPAIL